MRQDGTVAARAKQLRSNQTPAERALWHLLRAHRFGGIKITRQVPVGPYILDFAARSRRLAIEVDGDTHGTQVRYDAARTAFIETQGYRVIRFTNAEVMRNPEGVLATISAALAASPLPTLSPEGGGLWPPPSPLRGEGWGEGPPQPEPGK